MSGRAVEAAGDVQTLLLDKTGHHVGQPHGVELDPVGGHSEQEVADVAQLRRWRNETPEGRSIVGAGEGAIRYPRSFRLNLITCRTLDRNDPHVGAGHGRTRSAREQVIGQALGK